MVSARSSRSGNALGVWANGERVGTWSLASGEHRFQYDDGWIRSPAARRLSLSLPFTPGNGPHRGERVRNFFDNLLPDSDTIRRRLREKFAASSTEPFDLLTAIGRDCAGAVQLLPANASPDGFDRIESKPLSDDEVEAAIDSAVGGVSVLDAVGGRQPDDLRLSIAGAQEKTALLWHRRRWHRPQGATPTTHIFKLPLGLVGNLRADMSGSVENEWLCGQFLALLGLPVANSEIAVFGRRKILVVERFDRQLQSAPGSAPWIARLPQEDFCQALGVSGARKYENEGGPGMRDILRVLDASSRADADKLTFVNAQLAFWLLAATDGHAKNFSIFLARGGGFHLTPLYDVLSAWPVIGNRPSLIAPQRARLAMAVRSKNAHWNLDSIHTRHWRALAHHSGVPGAFDAMVSLVRRVPQTLERLADQLPADFPQRVWKPIRGGILAQTKKFTAGL